MDCEAALSKIETICLRDVVADICTFPEMVKGYFVVYRDTEDDIKMIFNSNNASELLGDIARAKSQLISEISIKDENDDETEEDY